MVVVSGTNRRGSTTRQVAGLVAELYAEAGVAVSVLDLAELPVELLAPEAYEEKPPGFAPFAEKVMAAHGLVVVAPEYNGSFPGALKVLIDHLKFPESFEGRPVAFVGLAAGQWGGLRGVEQLQQIFAYRNAHVYPRRVLIPQVSRAIGEDGKVLDADVDRHLRAQVEGFLWFVRALRGTS